MTHKFNVGDFVIGNQLANKHYILTKEGVVCEVVDVRDHDVIVVKYKNCRYTVHSACFDLYDSDKDCADWRNVFDMSIS